MARTLRRPDIAAARSHANFTLGSGRELTRLEEMLAADEKVAAMVQCRYGGCFGLAVLTDIRLLFLCDGAIWKISEDIPLDRVGLVQWQSAFSVGTLTVHAAGALLQLSGVHGPGGTVLLRGLREHVAQKDRLERQARDGILAMAARFASAPASSHKPEHFPDEVPERYFLTDEPELLPQH